MKTLEQIDKMKCKREGDSTYSFGNYEIRKSFECNCWKVWIILDDKGNEEWCDSFDTKKEAIANIKFWMRKEAGV